ncbi:Fc receptor-like protein 5 [Acipenser ruthenus]|uniref:Fc receptor-like protein 5 n=1 Tax=Acipenser ruthenus TaxID=7906 RepID=UPI002741BBFC|nr:Fc receptor-like protein 5 [Acipenser ruthenus]
MRAGKLYIVMLLTTVTCFGQETADGINGNQDKEHRELPQTTLTLEPPFPEIFTGETVTLRCGVEGGSAGWKYLWYKDSEDTPVPQTADRSITGDSYTITAAAVSDQGQYYCRGQRGDQPLYSQLSDKVILTVSDGQVILQTPSQPVFEGDSLTLRCRFRSYTATTVAFYKDNKELQSQAGTELSVARVSKSDEGSYKCRAWSSHYSAEVWVSVRELRQTTLTLEPPLPEIFTGETVTLRCGVEGGSAGWKYLWYKDSEDTPVLQTAGHSITDDSYTITAAAVSDQGQYCCRGQRGDQPLYSQLSDKVILTVSDGQVILQTPSQPVFEGDSLTLRCRFRSYTATTVAFYKDNKELQSQAGTELSVARVSKSDEGSYKCRAWSSSHYSAEVWVSVRELRQTTLTLEPPFPEIFTGETVTLRCGVEGGPAGWKYLWYKDSEDTPVLQTAGRSITGDSYTITAAAVSDQGQYWCRGQKGGQPLYSQRSDPVILNITELPKAVLTSSPQWGELYTGETVTLSCEVQGRFTGWRYLWYKKSEGGTVQQIGDAIDERYTIRLADQSYSGQYWCEAQGGDRPHSSQHSNPVTLTVSELPKAVLTSSLQWRNLYTGETVILSCGVKGGFTDWEYLWYKRSQGDTVQIRDTTGARYTLSSVTQSHSGQYQCEAQRGDPPRSFQRSDPFTLTVSELPKAVLTSSPQWEELYTGETVTLSCGVKGRFTGWEYLWYKSSQGDTVQIRDTTGARYTLSSVTQSHSGQYQCEAQRGDPPRSSQRSDPFTLTVSELPKAVLTSSPQWRNLYTGETVTLSCGVEGRFTGWKYLWYKRSQGDTVQIRDTTGARYTLSPVTQSHSGQYLCEAQRGDRPRSSQRSDPVTLTVSDQWVILQTPLQPVTEGDSLTLRCRVRTNYTLSRIVFFKDNEEIQSQNNTELSVDRVSKSDEGSYKCRAMWNSSTYSGDSAEVRVSVRELFSRVTLTASPGATVKEGEALNLTCEAAVNKTPRPQLHYTIVRDGEPVTNSTDSALYSIASTVKSHTGSYTCAVESQGVKKSSQELHIEVQTSWHSAVAIGYRVSFTLIHFIVFTLLLLQYCRIQGSLCIAGGTSR